MSEHTPGPWRLMTSPQGRKTYVVAGPEGQPFKGQVIWTPTTCPENEANARLIAAAPELLEALNSAERRLAKMAGGMHPPDIAVLQVIRAAIAKAEGRG